MSKNLIRKGEAMQILGCTEGQYMALVTNGTLKTVKLLGIRFRYFRREDVERVHEEWENAAREK